MKREIKMELDPTKKNYRHYIYFLFGQRFSMLGSLIVGFTITWWITIETGSAIYLSISVFLMFLPQIIVTPIAGIIADRWNKRAMIAISDSGQAAVTFLLFMFFMFDAQSIWLVLSINTFRAALFAFQLPAVSALVPVMIPKESLSRVNGMNFLFSGLIFSIGPVIAAALLAFFPAEQIFLLDIVTYLIAMVPLIIIRIPSVHRTTEESTKKSFAKDFKTGFLTIKMVPGLLAMIMFAMVWNFIYRPWTVLTPYFVRYTHDGTALNLALLTMTFSIGGFIGALITMVKKTWRHKIKLNIIGASLFFVGQIPAILAPQGNFILMMIVLFPGAVIFPITVSTYLTLLQSTVPKDKIGRVMSIDHMISMAIAPIGALIAGPLSESIGIVPLFLTCAIIGIIFPYFVWFFTKIKQLEIIDQENMLIAEKEKEVVSKEVLEVIEVVE